MNYLADIIEQQYENGYHQYTSSSQPTHTSDSAGLACDDVCECVREGVCVCLCVGAAWCSGSGLPTQGL